MRIRSTGRASHVTARDLQTEREDREIAVVDCELRDQEDRLKRCAITDFAESVVLLFTIQQIPRLHTTEFYGYRWTFAVATGFVVGISACFTPDWQYGVIMLIKYVVFTFLTLHSTACPMNQVNCDLEMGTSHVFLIGFVVVLIFRFASSRSNAEAFVTFMLDVVGLVYITGTLSILVSFVDDDIRILYRKLLIALLYIVWASDTGAYLVGKTLAFFNYPYYNPLAAHLSKNKDYEGTVGAIAFGIVAMVVASDILDLPGSFGTKVAYTVIAVVAGRLGDLFESLLKRAAGVKDSGKLIPGHGAFVSIPVCVVTSTIFLLSIQWVTEFESTEFYTYRWFFAIPTGYVVALCACLTPDWQYAVITLVKYGVFTILTLHSTACPMNELNCNLLVGTSEIFLGGMAVILVFRFASTPCKAEAFISFMLDIMGLLYVTGTLSILVAFVDDNHRTLYRKLLIALLYITSDA
ncbi:Hypothetical protein PHPALM_17122 [Phytophthora palmivora]|uniref:Phosphatidate cytidylyltransferase n=1 Tax=Phytophthora palmivora TaxID=4796 RepID=A0A2P4XN18_9STRA|nr:Hypothetical protein PHPALM_17122 [Phytophthora palmivora]